MTARSELRSCSAIAVGPRSSMRCSITGTATIGPDTVPVDRGEDSRRVEATGEHERGTEEKGQHRVEQTEPVEQRRADHHRFAGTQADPIQRARGQPDQPARGRRPRRSFRRTGRSRGQDRDVPGFVRFGRWRCFTCCKLVETCSFRAVPPGQHARQVDVDRELFVMDQQVGLMLLQHGLSLRRREFGVHEEHVRAQPRRGQRRLEEPPMVPAQHRNLASGNNPVLRMQLGRLLRTASIELPISQTAQLVDHRRLIRIPNRRDRTERRHRLPPLPQRPLDRQQMRRPHSPPNPRPNQPHRNPGRLGRPTNQPPRRPHRPDRPHHKPTASQRAPSRARRSFRAPSPRRASGPAGARLMLPSSVCWCGGSTARTAGRSARGEGCLGHRLGGRRAA